MKDEKDRYALSSVKKSDLEDGQWFPENPAKPPTKWSLLIALIDEIAIILLAIAVIYYVVSRF